MEHYPSSSDAAAGCGLLIVAGIAGAVIVAVVAIVWGILPALGVALVGLAIFGLLVSEA